jgi:hypothetical protein
MILYPLWIIAFHYRLFLLATCIIVCITVVNYVLNLQLNEFRRRYFTDEGIEFALHGSFSLMLGWVTVVSIAGIAHLFSAFELTTNFFSPLVQSMLFLTAGMGMALLYLFRLNNRLAAAAVAWMYFSFSNGTASFSPEHQYFSQLAFLLAGMISFCLLVVTVRNWYFRMVTY